MCGRRHTRRAVSPWSVIPVSLQIDIQVWPSTQINKPLDDAHALGGLWTTFSLNRIHVRISRRSVFGTIWPNTAHTQETAREIYT